MAERNPFMQDVNLHVEDAEVTDLNPLPVEIISGGGGGAGNTEYLEGAVDASIAGIAAMWEDAGDTLRPVSAAKPLPVVQTGTPALPTGAATSANQASEQTLVGAVTEAAPGTDTASSGLNGRLQRIAQRLTSLIALLPAALVGGRLDVNLGAAPAAVSLAAGTNNIGDVDVLSLPALPAGANNIGDVDVLSTVIPAGGTLVVPAAVASSTVAAALAAQACKEVLLQADPDNTVDLLIGDATNQTIQLTPGASLTLAVANGSQVRHKTVSGAGNLNVAYLT